MKRKHATERTPKQIFFLTAILLLITIVVFYYSPQASPPWSTSPPSPRNAKASSSSSEPSWTSTTLASMGCDLFQGEWVPDPDAPYYTNETCYAIHEHQNCMKYGRPDTEFMKWRWKPDGCELPAFDPAVFLEMVRGKSMAFVGDSVGRNQMQSLICLLSRVAHPVDALGRIDKNFSKWFYAAYNFTIANYWSPFLVKAYAADPSSPNPNGFYDLYLDEADGNWTTEIDKFDYVIASVGHWFYRPSMFYKNKKLVGCNQCGGDNVTDLTFYYSYRHAFRTLFAYLNNLSGYKGTIFLRTYSPSHFENGIWNKGGNCIRTRPFKRNETRFADSELKLYMTQVEEFQAAENMAAKKGLKFHLLDVTDIMLHRPDGHPNNYGHPPEAVALYNDCVHWCLPGPIDIWNDIMIEILKRDWIKDMGEGQLYANGQLGRR